MSTRGQRRSTTRPPEGWGRRGRVAALAGILFALAACAPTSTDRPSALLVTLDTTRADALSCYGGPAGLTPNLDALAAEGVLYENAHTVAPVTMTAHASMLTGLYPPRHGVRGNDRWALDERANTLAEQARAAGVQTAASVAAIVLHESFGLAQGFETYAQPEMTQRPGIVAYDERVATQVVDEAVAWLAQRDRSRPFFLWVHLFDPHASYSPPPPFRNVAGDHPAYHGEVAFMDREIGRLVEHLRDDDAWPHLTMVVVGDHGEALGDHGEKTHGVLCQEATMRVPFLLRHPDLARAGERSPEIVSVVDVFPTLADALGLELLDGIDGISLHPGVIPPRYGIYFESYEGFLAYGYSPVAGWLNKHGKYLHSSTPRFFDLDDDPRELHDLLRENAGLVDAARGHIERLVAKPSLPPAQSASSDPETLARLRALGYAALGDVDVEFPHPLAPCDRPSAAEVIELHEECLAGLNAFHAGQLDRAEQILGRVVTEMPRNTAALLFLGQTLVETDRPAEALPLFDRFLRDRPDLAFAHYQRAECLRRSGRAPEAVSAYEDALEREPTGREYYPALIQLLGKLGRTSEAQEWARRMNTLTNRR